MKKYKLAFLFVLSVNLFSEPSVYGIPVSILYPLIYTESTFNPDAVNKNSDGSIDYGLMQLNSKYLKYFYWKFNNNVAIDPMNARENLRIGCAYLLHLYNYTGSWRDAIWAYNAGPGNWEKRILPEKTKNKLKIIFSAYLRRDYMSEYTHFSTSKAPEVIPQERGGLNGWEQCNYGEPIESDISWIPQIMKQPWGFNRGMGSTFITKSAESRAYYKEHKKEILQKSKDKRKRSKRRHG